MNHGLTLILPFSLSRLVSRNLRRWVWASILRVYKVFTKTGRGPWLRRLCLGPAGVINCTPLSALSFWVSLFPGKCGYNIFLSVWIPFLSQVGFLLLAQHMIPSTWLDGMDPFSFYPFYNYITFFKWIHSLIFWLCRVLLLHRAFLQLPQAGRLLSVEEHGLGLLTAMVSPVAVCHMGFSSCSTARVISLDRGWNLWTLHWQAVLPTELPEKSHITFFKV